ncbi:unnamed protein product [Rotaria magnacalcarata]|nr:unnamed protein product [Rotaria magnacalcarata]
MQEIKKAQKQIILQQQLQSTISVSQFPASQSCVSPMQIRTDEAINTSAAPNINLVPTSQSKNNAKRRIVSEPERSFSTKRSRT